MTSLRDKEQLSETTFLMNGPYWHLFTSGKNTPLLFSNKSDFAFGMNVICKAAFEYQEIRIIAFEIMSNHLHFLISGDREIAVCFFDYMKKCILRGLSDRHPEDFSESFSPMLKAVENLRSLRYTIAYINRNGYVSDFGYTPFSYPWGTNNFYFFNYPQMPSYGETPFNLKRTMFRSRVPDITDSWQVGDGYILPSSYCHINIGMSLYRDAHQYFAMVSKGVEAYSEIAAELDDSEFLSDTEIFKIIYKILIDRYNLQSIRELSKAQKQDIARTLHFDYRSSNGQIRRLLGLTQYEVEMQFPLAGGSRG